ncbi:MAG: hypothetical protein ACOCV2_08095 [Persicimonas sp.]
MSQFTRQHRALLNALVAEDLVPRLIARLSLERVDARPGEARKLRDWVRSLRNDPAWPLLEAQLDRPGAWPEVWVRAKKAGFSPRTDHHHALLFERICDELVEAHDLEVARFCWRECNEAWLRVFDSDYAENLLDKLSTNDAVEPAKLMHRLAEARLDELQEALRLDRPGAPTEFDRRRVRFGWGALDFLVERLEASAVEHPVLDGLLEHTKAARESLVDEIATRFESSVESLDLSEARDDEIAHPFEWVSEVFTILPKSPSVAARIVGVGVETGWTLRKLERDGGEALMGRLLRLTEGFNDRLEEALHAGDAFGHNAACADYLVFLGERSDRNAARESYFERALSVCPGHRNASMMLSYEKLRKVSGLLTRMRLAPAALRVIPGATVRLDSALRRAASLVDDAEELFPSNDEIPEFRREIEAEADRLGADIDE